MTARVILCWLQDWIQYEELSSEDALPSEVCEADGFSSSLFTSQSSLPDHLANIPNVIIYPRASGEENEDVSVVVVADTFTVCSVSNLTNFHFHASSKVLTVLDRGRQKFVFGAENGLFGRFWRFSFSAENEFTFSFYFSFSFKKCHFRWAENVLFATGP